MRLLRPRLSAIAHSSSLILSIALDRDANEERRPNLKLTLPADTTAFVPASVLLQRLHDEAPADHFTLGWLMSRMHKRSFGLIMLLLAVVAVAPGVSIVAGLLLMIPAFQMILGQNMPVFPRRIAARPLPTRHLAALVQRAVPVLRSLEKLFHPRWPTPFDATKRLVGAVVVLLNITLLFTPVPLSNVVPALVIALISLAYLEEDGLLLSIALLASVVVLAVELAAVWETVLGAKWIFGLWY
ncbi:exopolysaccharide biosynthesis protein [Bradyrhizobium sp. CCBAU 11386]|uniref:exopolysaccharide biosynthesis protein n=1 Tax=Bradyrhizobium sp. CCBAU 11386 TaxID=1630837 RepID=UPI0023032BA7|nr:exopolysaccharide biosynthesis protein [Bradyrhizobium sp. CCBAU 11386]